MLDKKKKCFATYVDLDTAVRFEEWCKKNDTNPYQALKRAINSLTKPKKLPEIQEEYVKEPDCW